MEPIGPPIVVRQALRALGDGAGVEAVAIFVPEGGFLKQIILDGVKVGTALLPGPAVARRLVRLGAKARGRKVTHGEPVPLPKSMFLVLFGDRLAVHKVKKPGRRLGAKIVEFARGSYEVADVRTAKATIKFLLRTPHGLDLRLETGRIALDEPNAAVIDAIAAAGAGRGRPPG